jgi:hypothetical protein
MKTDPRKELSDMTRADAVHAFGSQSRLALALGMTRQAVCQWPKDGPLKQIVADWIDAAAKDRGITVPRSLKKRRAA